MALSKLHFMARRYTTEEFVAKATLVHGGRYTYEKVLYRNKLSQIIVTCPNHGDYKVSATIHIQGYMGRCCSSEAKKGIRTRKDTFEYLARKNAKNNNQMFFNGSICRICKNTKRYSCNNSCVECSIVSRQKSNAKHNSVRHKRIYQANIYRDNVDIQNELKLIYLSVRKMEKSFKEKLHIDHIIPIKAKNACGLHVPWNLMVTTATYNQSKQAKISLDIPMCLKRNSVIIHQSALPWNLKKENHVNIL